MLATDLEATHKLLKLWGEAPDNRYGGTGASNGGPLYGLLQSHAHINCRTGAAHRLCRTRHSTGAKPNQSWLRKAAQRCQVVAQTAPGLTVHRVEALEGYANNNPPTATVPLRTA